jgi:hypothetical protein
VSARLFQRTTNQIDFKASHFFVEINTAADIADGSVTGAIVMTLKPPISDR